jgi:hypothetical protein
MITPEGPDRDIVDQLKPLEPAMLEKSLRMLVSSLMLSTLIAAAAPAAAHDKWLEVEPFFADKAVTTKIYLVTGDALRQPEAMPIRQRSRILRFQLQTATGKRELLPMLHEDQQPIAALPSGTLPQGTSTLVLETAPTDILLAAEKFQSYLFEERLFDILMERAEHREEDQPGRERYTRYIKAVVQSGAKLDDGVTRPVGQDLEIVPLTNPYGISIGGKVIVQVLYRGQPLPKRALTTASRYRSNVVSKNLRTDKHGQVTIALDRAGQWLISLVHMERSREPGADWRSYWVSLTFELREPAL